MKRDILKKIGVSALRVTAALAVIFGLPAICYWLWPAGEENSFTGLRDNAIWIGHGWLGDDSWFERNKRNKDDFRSEEKISKLFKKLADNKISIVYPHLCPAQFNGRIAPYDSVQTERFLDLAEQYKIRVIPWVGGILYESARPGDKKWKKNFFASIKELFEKHPRIAGIQINIEPMPNGDREFLQLLEELRAITGKKILSVAAYPPPTKWHQYPNVHWEIFYLQQIADRCDQMAVMMYDTAIPLEKFYTNLMIDWTRTLAGVSHQRDLSLILGVPAYEDAGVGYHYPNAENIASALRGIAAADCQKDIDGIALYCEWEMTKEKWQIWQKFIK